MQSKAFIRIAAILAVAYLSDARPLGHYEGLAEIYMPVFGSNVIANDTATASSPPATSTANTDKTEPACKPFVMPPVPEECRRKSGELACHGYSLYCRFPADYGVAYEPVGECWTCK
ncbi:uncharacterized protein F4822DRAFT_192519 [Hypoxylon trugodes]|uniref:uncharacterized protein n=1 Tax=Hypoxylon trugodes TaxID=326681 RepID=UPI002197BE3C|nr:uncharacterized protein F4822DRAFT_192519 [Hypoxylon trugodes]KAI1391662.1 hypothetical protein F4822DRAFT_192519 [Hypoxylon trugodes]